MHYGHYDDCHPLKLFDIRSMSAKVVPNGKNLFEQTQVRIWLYNLGKAKSVY